MKVGHPDVGLRLAFDDNDEWCVSFVTDVPYARSGVIVVTPSS